MPNRLHKFCLIDTKSCLIAIWLKSRKYCGNVLLPTLRTTPKSTPKSKTIPQSIQNILIQISVTARLTGAISICEPVVNPCRGLAPVTYLSAMHSSESEQSSDDSGAGDDPHQSRAVPNSLLQLQGDYASGSDDFVPITPERAFDEQTRFQAQSANAISSARGSLVRLSRNDHLMNTIGRLPFKKSRQF